MVDLTQISLIYAFDWLRSLLEHFIFSSKTLEKPFILLST